MSRRSIGRLGALVVLASLAMAIRSRRRPLEVSRPGLYRMAMTAGVN